MLYVHIPFCRAKCAYCDFYSTPKMEWMEGYVKAIAAEFGSRATPGWVPDTLYFGGGTPSVLPIDLLDKLVSSLRLPEHLTEATIEINPEDVSSDFVRWLALSPFNRVSMGVQSLNDAELQFVGRRHSAADVVEAVKSLRESGINNISLDIIYGLPGQTFESWKQSLDLMLALAPEHISAYLLSYEPRTRLGVMLAKGKVHEADEELVERMYAYLCRATRKAGYEHYEISNFAKPGFRAIHNSGYWSGRDYLGLGPAAHSFYGGVRGYNPADLNAYIDHCGTGIHVIEQESEANKFNDMLITGLRTADGIDLAKIRRSFSAEVTADFFTALPSLSSRGCVIESSPGYIAIPEEKWLESNSIMLEMIAV